MKDNHARILAIIALVFMGVFVIALVATLVDRTLFNGGIGYIALGAGVFTLAIFIALKADGRGFSFTKMNNEKRMRELEEQENSEDGDIPYEEDDKTDSSEKAPDGSSEEAPTDEKPTDSN